MTVTEKTKNKTGMLRISGNLIGEDHGATILELINNKINKGIIQFTIDLSDVKYMNSSGIGVLISVLTKVRNRSGDLVVIKPSEHIQKLLLITKLNKIFKIADNEKEALELLAK